MGDPSTSFLEALPDALVFHILSFIHNARDVAVCSCVSRKWKETMSQAHKLYFPRNVGSDKGYMDADLIVTMMVLRTTALRELVVYSPFSTSSLLAWLTHTKSSLQSLELRLDELGDKRPANGNMSKLDCISYSQHLRTLRLWGVLFTKPLLDWQAFKRLRTLEIVGARFEDDVIHSVLLACPLLTHLTLLGCEGLRILAVDLEYLVECRLDLCGAGDAAVTLNCPSLSLLEVQGAAWVRLTNSHSLQHLAVANTCGKVYKLQVGRLPTLKSLSLRGVQWSWDSIDAVLQAAVEIRELRMRVEFCGDGDKMEAFPEVDLVDFFASHPHLRLLEAQGAMFAALAQKSSLKKVTPVTFFPCLEEAWVTIRSPLNGDLKMATLESFIRCCPNLRRFAVKVTQMKAWDETADDFFCKVVGLQLRHRCVTIE